MVMETITIDGLEELSEEMLCSLSLSLFDKLF